MKVSIITASYNYAQYIEEAINSVIQQSYQDWELIIVDDGSIDNSVEIIKNFCIKDNRIKLFQHENGENKGLKETILLGLKHSSGDWIAFLESDDILGKENLQQKVNVIEKYPNVKLIFNRVDFLAENENLKNKYKKGFNKKQNKLAKMSFPRNMFYDFYINNMILTFSCVMIEAKAFKSMNFNTPIDALLDWWLWIHLAYKNQFYYINEILTFWRLHSESYMKRSRNPILYSVQISAYEDIYKRNKKNFNLLFFILYSNIELLFFRTFRFLKRLITE